MAGVVPEDSASSRDAPWGRLAILDGEPARCAAGLPPRRIRAFSIAVRQAALATLPQWMVLDYTPDARTGSAGALKSLEVIAPCPSRIFRS